MPFCHLHYENWAISSVNKFPCLQVSEIITWLRNELLFIQPFLKDAELKQCEIIELYNGCLRSTLLLMTLSLYTRLTALRLVNVLVVSRLVLAYVGRRRNSTMSPRRSNHSRNESWISLANERLMDVVQNLLAELLKAEPRRSVLSIYGMGGLGKTTLARKLYTSPSIASSFPTRAWICVSQEYNTMDLFRNIIKSIQGRTKETLDLLERMTEGDLEIYLRDLLQERKYLVVVDDVWQKEA
ncbi:hypothetical protein KY285_019489 [Solanum tuberosum]|nr:hypothetical protein KY285_019489 [Solanum tuberosum]